MRRSPLLAAIALTALALTALTGLAVGAAPPARAANAPVRVMPLGDSITGSPGCWRALLWNRLQANGYDDLDFVGTLPPQGCGVAYDGDNEGHGGALATGIAGQNQLPGWLAATHPDIVLMHLGTNDVWNGLPTATILAAYTTLVGQMRADNPAVRVVVAQIIPMNPAGCAACAQGVVNLDAAIPAWAAGLTTAQSPISVVDQWTGFTDATDTGDGVHPNDAGNQKMAARWYDGLTPLLTAGPTTSPSPTADPTGVPPTGTACRATLTLVNQWQGGFQATVTVTDTGQTATTGWSVGLGLAGGQALTQVWNARTSGAAPSITAVNETYNGALPPGATTTFGFLGSGPATPTPTVTCAAH